MAVKRSFRKRVLLSTALLAACAGLFQPHAFAEDFQDALVAAYQRNPRLMAERARVREADENYVQAQAGGRFTITAEGNSGFTRSKTPASPFPPSDGLNYLRPRTGQVTLVQPLYQGGRIKGLKSQAKSGILAARQGLRNAEQTVLLSAATAYLDVLRDEEAAVIRRNNVSVLTRQRFAAQDRFDVGEGTRTDIAQAEARLASAEIGLSQADAQLAISRAAYMRYMGHAPLDLATPPQFVLPETLYASQIRARANNPQLVASRYNENAAQAAVYVAKSASRPTVALNGALQGSRDSSANIPRASSASVTAQVRIPIWSGGLNRSRVRAAKHAKTRSKFETRETELAVDEAVANLWAQVVASERALISSRKQVAAAEIAFEGVELEQQVGTRSTLDVLDAEQELLNAKLTVVQAERNLNVAGYQLLVTLGGFDAYSLQLPVEQYDPNRNFDYVTSSPYAHIPFNGVIPIGEKVIGGAANVVDQIVPLGKKVIRDTSDLVDALVPGDARVFSKVGQDVSDLGEALATAGGPETEDGSAPRGNVVGRFVKQVPNIPASLVEAVLIGDPEAKNADPDAIEPDPELILLEVKPKP